MFQGMERGQYRPDPDVRLGPLGDIEVVLVEVGFTPNS